MSDQQKKPGKLVPLDKEQRAEKAAKIFLDANESMDADEALNAYFEFIQEDDDNARLMTEYNTVWDSIEQIEDLAWPEKEEITENRNQFWARGLTAIAAGFAILAIFAGVLLLREDSVSSQSIIALATERGEQLSTPLEDGSIVMLGGNAIATVEISGATRSVQLAEGDAFVNVAPDPERPFIVDAGTISVQAIGTAFNVAKNSQTVIIDVGEGIVEVRKNTGSSNSIRLVAGQQLYFTPDQGFGSVGSISTDDVGAWQRGELILNDMPLSVAVESINRYFDGEVTIDSDQLADLRASGVVNMYEPTDWLQSLEMILPVAVNRTGANRYTLQYDE